MGRIGVDVYPLQTGVSASAMSTSFGKYLGGSSSNVAVAAARYGHQVATITRTGDDPFGEFLHDALQGFGVDDRYVDAVDHLPTPVTFCEIFPPDDFPLYFYREPKAPDLEIHAHELDLDAIKHGQGLLGDRHRPLARNRAAPRRSPRSRRAGGITVLDLDWRPDVLGQPRGGAQVGARGAPARDRRRRQRGRVGDRGRRRDATSGGRRPARHRRGQARARPACSRQRGDEIVEVPPAPVEVVNGLGAGDAFGGALCHGLLEQWDLERTMRFANAAGAIVAGRLACADAMPTRDEVEAKLEEAVNA